MANRFIRLLAIPGLVVAGLALPQSSALGAFTVTASSGGSALTIGAFANLDGRALGGASQTGTNGLTISFTGNGAIVNGSVANQYAAPTLSGNNNLFFEPTTPPGADTTNYASTGTGSAVISLTRGPLNYLGLLWGSVDSYNSLTFNLVDGTTQTFTGSQIVAIAGSNPTGTLYANFTSTIAFTSVVASSTANSFEFDNVAYAAVPEPSSMALCGIASVIGVVVARKRAKQVVA